MESKVVDNFKAFHPGFLGGKGDTAQLGWFGTESLLSYNTVSDSCFLSYRNSKVVTQF